MWLPMIEFPFPGWLERFQRPQYVAPEPVIQPKAEEPTALLHLGKELTTGKRFVVNRDAYKSQGERIAVLASSGMGKSYVGGVMMEGWLDMETPLIIIDPEGEAHTLAEKYPVVIFGGEHQAEGVTVDLLTGEDQDIQKLVETIITEGLSVIFDLSEWLPEDQYAIFARVIGVLFATMSQESYKRRMNLIVDEAHVFGPQQLESQGQKPCLEILTHIAKRGRKRGLGLMVMTQRPASISKNILNQCNVFLFGPMTSALDAQTVSNNLKQYNLSKEDVLALKQGQFYYSDRDGTTLIEVKKRKCRHGGDTPEDTGSKKFVKTKAAAAAIAAKIGGKTESI